MGFEVVGREAELACLDAFISAGEPGPAALVLAGEAGIGKSVLWEAGVEQARSAGLVVLASRAVEAERTLDGVGLVDLLELVVNDALPVLLTPRRRALEIVLLREEASADPVDRRALAVAVRDLLQLVCREGRLLLAIDDAQWLDPLSASALAFALRRLSADDVILLLARRAADGVGAKPLEQALPGDRVRRLRVGPLSMGALHLLLRDRLGKAFPRQTLVRIQQASGGNPFFALELARALGAEADPLAPLPIPETLESLLRARLAGLPGATREALGLASALGATPVSLLERADIAPEVLEPAVALHAIELEDGTLRFSHPLLASVVYEDLDGARRRSAHATIAEAIGDPLLRARHLALSKEGPDPEIAAILDDAAGIATARGGAAAAAELAEHAIRLTPSEAADERRRRELAAARAHQAAGEWTRARVLATDLLAETEVDSLRAEALVLLSELESVDRATELLEQGLLEAGSQPTLQALIHCRLAWMKRFRGGSEHAATALELAERLGDDELRARARAVQAVLEWFAGRGDASGDLPALAQHLPAALGSERLVQEATQALVNTLAPTSERDQVRTTLEWEYSDWRDRDEPRAARALWGLSWVEFWAGNWKVAAEHAARAYDIAIQYGLEVPQDHLPLAVIAVHRGQLELAREHSERALELAEEQFGFHPPQHMAVLGLVAAWSGDRSGALEWFEKAERRAAVLEWHEPSVRWWTADYAELLLELGRIDDAVRLVDAWEADAVRVTREWVLAHVTRCRGLGAAAGGDVEKALALLTGAVTEHEAVGDLFGRARALLVLGAVRRRARQKRPAREAIQGALEAFEAIGASRWAERARAELSRVGGRTRAVGLTAAERRVAALVAEGKTNREVASALFLGERTVASHLTHIYAKIGVRSRTELARRLRANEPT